MLLRSIFDVPNKVRVQNEQPINLAPDSKTLNESVLENDNRIPNIYALVVSIYKWPRFAKYNLLFVDRLKVRVQSNTFNYG